MTITINKILKNLDEFSVCKLWELDNDKFYIDASPKELKQFIKKNINELLEEREEKIKAENLIAYNAGYEDGVGEASNEILNKI